MKIQCYSIGEVYFGIRVPLKGGDAMLIARKGDRAIRL